MIEFLRQHPIAIAAVLLLAIIALRLVFSSGRYRYEAKPLLTKNELQFYLVLRNALPEFCVFPQVAMNAFLKPPSGLSTKRYAQTRGTFAQKHIDFLVCEPQTLEIMAIIELDDRSHSEEKDIARDRITGSAGYRTIRFHSQNKPGESKIREVFSAVLKSDPGARVVAY